VNIQHSVEYSSAADTRCR